ncbi:MAG: hypothetical protein ABIC40_04105 [bacterium]
MKSRLHHAFAIGDEFEEKLGPDENALLNDIATRIHSRGLIPVAIPFLLFHKPLNFIGANALQMGEIFLKLGPIEVFLKKFLGPNYTHDLLVQTLEKRCSIDVLIEMLEEKIDG